MGRFSRLRLPRRTTEGSKPLNSQCKAILLLTASFGRAAAHDERPLSAAEWARFAQWLRSQKIDPAQLLSENIATLLKGWIDQKVSLSRLEKLLGRGMALGLSADRWEGAGLWILTRSHPEYPIRLKNKLGFFAPPVLFGCGNRKLLDQGGVAVVGSRNINEECLSYTRKLAVAVSEFGKSIISGGARGVDITAMETTLKADGTCVGVLADSLMKASASARFRKHIFENSLALVSPFNPEAGFNVGNAMSRNRYIYCLSDCAVVIDSTQDKGGTWNGAEESLKHKWVPVFVKPSENRNSGNTALLEMGARQATLNVQELYNGVKEFDNVQSISEEKIEKNPASELFECFLSSAKFVLKDQELKADEVADQLCLTKKQTQDWLNKAANEGHIVKHKRPVRFGNPLSPTKLPLFNETKVESTSVN